MSLIIAKVDSADVEEDYRIVKAVLFGDKDVRTADEAMPHGIDAHPVKDLLAVWAITTVSDEPVIVGYVNKNRLADAGELRLYATDADGAEQNYIWLKADGNIEIGGDADNMVRYSELKTAFDQLKSDFNDLVTAYNGHIHVTTATIGASPTPGVISPTTSTGTPSTADISPAKIDEIKTS